MIYELAGAFGVVFVALVLYASLTLDIQQSYARFRRQQRRLSGVRVE